MPFVSAKARQFPEWLPGILGTKSGSLTENRLSEPAMSTTTSPSPTPPQTGILAMSARLCNLHFPRVHQYIQLIPCDLDPRSTKGREYHPNNHEELNTVFKRPARHYGYNGSNGGARASAGVYEYGRPCPFCLPACPASPPPSALLEELAVSAQA